MPELILEKRLTRSKLSIEMRAEIRASLTETDWRLLHWLLRYPLQRADDLIIGVARWTSRATVYRHMQGLAAKGLVESVLPKTPGAGKRLYHLSNLGLHLLARHLEEPPRELVRGFHADDAGLLRLLPRVPTLLVLQDVVNGLVTHAAEAMTIQGRKPRLVRWNWQRDVTHRFQHREQVMRFFADGLVALCIRTQNDDGSVIDQWYGLFILFTWLDDERLMRLRLERLVCWRESSERWSSYQHMLPVLILAVSPRQCEHWRRAIESTALRLRLHPLAGALTYAPPAEGADENPWLFNWRTLATAVSCHLRDLLRPLPRTAFPPSLQLEEGEDDTLDSRAPIEAPLPSVSPVRSTRLRRLIRGNLAQRAAQITRDTLEEQEVIALLGLRLTSCQWSILRLLLAHPFLSDEEQAALLNIQGRSVRCSLYELHQLGCLEPIKIAAGKRWHLCERGLRLIAAASHIHIHTLAVESEDEAERKPATILQRGEAWLLQHIQHTAGVYGFFARLARDARQEAGQALCWWESGAMCERRYQLHEHWHNLRPDALAEYEVGQQRLRFWLEWDRGTMNARDLEIKFRSYAHFIASREWAKDRAKLPLLVCIAPDIAQERRMQRVAQARLLSQPEVKVWTTTDVLLQEYGPLAPIWLQGISERREMAKPHEVRDDEQRVAGSRQRIPIVIASM